jgi:hypothetical protein
MGFVVQPSIAKRPESGAPSIRGLHSRGNRPTIGICVIGLTLDAVSVCAEDSRGALEEIHPTVTLPTITVEARSPAFDPAFEINSVTVLDRDALARSEERELNGVLRGLPGCHPADARQPRHVQQPVRAWGERRPRPAELRWGPAPRRVDRGLQSLDRSRRCGRPASTTATRTVKSTIYLLAISCSSYPRL